MADELPNVNVGAEIVEQTPEPSLRDTIRASLEQATKPIEQADGTVKPATDAAPERDEHGRFIPKQTETPKRETLTLPARKPAPSSPAGVATAAGSPANAVKPPDGWTAAAKAKFATLDPDIQAEVLRREKEAHQKITSQDSDRDFGSRVRRAAEPYSAIIQAEGGTHEAAFKDYLNTAYILRTGTPQAKVQALQIIAQRFNVPLGPLQQQAPNQAPAFQPADVQRLVQAEIQNQRQVWEQQTLSGEIEAFAAAEGHEHFETVKPVMAALLESGVIPDTPNMLQEAYERALYADPTIRSTLSAQVASDAEAKRLAESKQRTDAAKRAAVSVTGGPGGVKPPANGAGDRSLRDEIKANLAAAQGRV